MDDRWIKDLKRRCRGLIEILSQHLPGGTQKNDESPQSGQPLYRPEFEPNTTTIYVKSFTAAPTRSVIKYYAYCDVLVTRHRVWIDWWIYWIPDIRNLQYFHCAALRIAHPKPSQSAVSSRTRCLVAALVVVIPFTASVFNSSQLTIDF
jgi:hypothetical protein